MRYPSIFASGDCLAHGTGVSPGGFGVAARAKDCTQQHADGYAENGAYGGNGLAFVHGKKGDSAILPCSTV